METDPTRINPATATAISKIATRIMKGKEIVLDRSRETATAVIHLTGVMITGTMI